MKKKHRIAEAIEISGWLGGLVTVTLGNYLMIPIVTNKTGQRPIAIIIGLIIGVPVMFGFVSAAQYLANVLRKRYGTSIPDRSKAKKAIITRSKVDPKKSKFSTPRNVSLVSIILALLIDSFSGIAMTGSSTRISSIRSIGLILGLIIILFVVIKVTLRLITIFYKKYELFKPEKKKRFRRVFYICLLVVPLGLIGTVTLWEMVLIPMQPVAQVRMENGSIRKITTKEFLKRLRYEREQQQALKKTASGDNSEYGLGFAGTVLDQMTHEILVRELAEKRGLTVSEEEIDQLIKQTEPTSKTVLETPPPIPRYGLTKEEVRDIFRLEILEKKLQEAFFHVIPVKQERVRLKLIRFESAADARGAVTSRWSNTAFADLYDRVSNGTVRGATGTIRDWSSADELKHDYNLDFSEAAFRLDTGGCFPQPVPAAGGWYLAQALGHEVRTMSEEWRKQRGEDTFQNWLDQQQTRITQFPVWMKRVPPPPHSSTSESGSSAAPPVPNPS